jgi:hypothetical protein
LHAKASQVELRISQGDHQSKLLIALGNAGLSAFLAHIMVNSSAWMTASGRGEGRKTLLNRLLYLVTPFQQM